MNRHLLKLIWNRKRSNALVIAEIFVSFLVLFVVLAFGLWFGSNYRQPLGYDIRNVWRMEIAMHAGEGMDEEEAQRRHQNIMAELERMPEVEAVAGVLYPPYFMGSSEQSYGFQGRSITVQSNESTGDLARVLDFDLVSGRWFGPEDDAANWTPVVIDGDLAAEVWGRTDVAGERLPFMEAEHRVIGVISDYKKSGELSRSLPTMFFRAGPTTERPLSPHLLISMRPGVDAAMEETIVRRVSALAPGWSFQVQPLEQLRRSSLRLQIIPLLFGVTIAGFLVLMVALGLTGIMWQTVTRRTRELGLRRAVGSSAHGVYRQIVFETVILALGGILLGLIIALQLPLLGVGSFFGSGIYTAALVLTSGTIVLLAVACGLYPGWLASRIEPAEALRHD